MEKNNNKKQEETPKDNKKTAAGLLTKWKKMEKAKKDKIFFGTALLAILVISILTANVNLTEQFSLFVKKIWNNAQEAVEETAAVETLSKGAHVEIKNTQTAHLMEIYEILGEDISEAQAVAILQEVKTLAYHGTKRGVAAGSREVEDFVNELKQKMKDANASGYNRLLQRYKDEDDYWAALDGEIKEYIISEKVKEDKREELQKKKDIDVEQKLQEYIDEIVGYEDFQ